MTVLEMVNKLRRRLREAEVTDLTDEYSELLLDFVNDTIGEMQDDYDWTQLRNEVAFPTVADQEEYDLTPYGVTNESYLLMDPRGNCPLAYLFGDINDNDGYGIPLISDEYEWSLRQQDRTSSEDEAAYFTIRAGADGYQRLLLWPTPATAQYVRTKWWTPLAAFDTDDGAETITLPERPVFLGALMLALNERGEEMGEPGNVAERRYRKALSRAVANDKRVRGQTNEFEAWRD